LAKADYCSPYPFQITRDFIPKQKASSAGSLRKQDDISKISFSFSDDFRNGLI